MIRFLVYRGMVGVFTIWVTTSLAFFALRILPGDAIVAQFAQSGASEAEIKDRRDELGLNKPLLTQYAAYWNQLLRGDFGMSLYGGQTVREILAQRIPTTVTLAGVGMVVAIFLGLGLGIGAYLENIFISSLCQLVTDLSISVPIYWSGTLALFLIAPWLGGQRSIVLPMIILGFHSAGAIAQIVKTNLHETKRHAWYIRAARGKGLSERGIFFKHLLPVSFIAVMPVIGVQAGILLSGTVITETLFQHAGVGQMLWDATLERNYPVVQGGVIFVTTVYITVNTLADITMAWMDPRLRTEHI